MQIFTELNHNPNLSICLGFFDGVHQGHKVVLKNTVNLAQQNGLKSAVITFKDHPLCCLQGRKPKYIVPLKERLALIEQQGIDYAYVIDFDEDMADLIASDYLNNILIKNFSPKFITTGFNHFFGANKQGDASFLRRYKDDFGYEYYEIPPITFNNVLISSSKIRQYITEANTEAIPPLLGEYFYVKGIVRKGKQLGRTISFPTINVEYPDDVIKPPHGVYAAIVSFDGFEFHSMANLGHRPTVEDNGKLLLEAHLIDFKDDLYEKEVKVSFVKKIRDEMKFESVMDLKSRLVKDEAEIKKYFSSLSF